MILSTPDDFEIALRRSPYCIEATCVFPVLSGPSVTMTLQIVKSSGTGYWLALLLNFIPVLHSTIQTSPWLVRCIEEFHFPGVDRLEWEYAPNPMIIAR